MGNNEGHPSLHDLDLFGLLRNSLPLSGHRFRDNQLPSWVLDADFDDGDFQRGRFAGEDAGSFLLGLDRHKTGQVLGGQVDDDSSDADVRSAEGESGFLVGGVSLYLCFGFGAEQWGAWKCADDTSAEQGG